MALGAVIPWLYMGLFLLIGWRLYTIGWPLWLKIASAVAMVVGPPLLFLLSGLRNPDSEAAALAQAAALSMFLMGGICLLGGVGATWLRERARGGR